MANKRSWSDLAQSLCGVGTALVTPMTAQGNLDAKGLDRLVDRQMEAGVQSLVALGTTGEAATLTETERRQIMRQVIDRVAGRVPVLVGTGAQSTAAALETQRVAAGEGADCALVVTPFYNKPTQQGLIRHYTTLADGSALPLMLYNVPSRTACDLKPDAVGALSQHENIVGIKDATGDLGRLDALLRQTPKGFVRLSGDDATTCAFCLMGGDGVISVTSNVAPKPMVQMVAAARTKDAGTAQGFHQKLVELMEALFVEPNPIPTKAALLRMGEIESDFLRLPLESLAPAFRPKLHTALIGCGLLIK